MQNDYFDLDLVFDLAKTGVLWEKFGFAIKRPFPGLLEIMNNYQTLLLQVSRSVTTTPYGTGQTYERVIKISRYGYYRLIWDISTVLSIIQKKNIRQIDVPIANLINTVDIPNLDLNYLYSGMFQPHPILVAAFPVVPEQFVVIDGNHTLYFFHQLGYRGVKGYLLQVDDHLQSMASDLFRTLYAVHSNITSIGIYMTNINLKLSDLKLLPVPYRD